MERCPRRLGPLLWTLLALTGPVHSRQEAGRVGSPATWVGGYARDVRGEVIEYDSALPEVRSALLVRSLDAGKAIEWETEPVPDDLESRQVTFVWLFGTDAETDRHGFTLSVDGEPRLAVVNPPATSLDAWEVQGEGGARLRLRPTRIDRHGDVFGFAELELPRGQVRPGGPVRLTLTGESAGSRVWWMTFRASPKPSVRVTQPAAVRRDGELRWQPLAVEVVHMGAPGEVAITSSYGSSLRAPLELGHNRYELAHPVVAEPVDESVDVQLPGGKGTTMRVRVEPVRPWTVHLVQHSHTDIGYTRTQTEILAEQVRYLDYALDFCDATDDWPDEARFRWTCEAAWPVAEFLRTRPRAQVERFLRRVDEGRIEVTTMFANLSELLDERSCLASLDAAGVLRYQPSDLPVTTAMQDDVNGIAWTYVDRLVELGQRYVVMGQHGHRARVPFDVPTAFWWESPSGRRLLAWRADHYMTGNLWSLHGERLEPVERELMRYLEGLERRGYPWERVAVQYSGVLIDNAPPGLAANAIIRRWNERYEWPRLVSSTVSQFPRWVEEHHADDLPVLRKAWPDWWSDGLGSAPRELAAVRRTQGRLAAVEGLLAMCTLLGTPPEDDTLERVASARESVVFYGEHTYGAAESISDPGAVNSVSQWGLKQAYAWEAVKETARAEEAALGLLQAHLGRARSPTLTVVNTQGHPRTGLARVWIDRALLPPERPFVLEDEHGVAAQVQELQRLGDGSWWGVWAREVPALGWRTWNLRFLQGDRVPAEPQPVATALESPFLRLRPDPETGAIASLRDKQLDRELVDPAAPWQLGRLVHESLLGDRHQLELFTLEQVERTPSQVSRIEPGADGPIFKSLIVHGSTPLSPGEDGFRLELRMYALAKRLELCYRVRKRPSTEPEGLYVAMPFALDAAGVRYETVGGVVDPQQDLIPGTAADWHAVQGFVSIEDQGARVLVSSPDTLLWQLGGLNLGRFEPVARVEQPHLYPWLLNNYWVTNFLASEAGELEWSFALTSEPCAAPASSAARFGLEEIVPLLARALPGGEPRPARRHPGSTFELSAPNVVLVGARPAGTRVQLLVREVEGRPARLRVVNPRDPGHVLLLRRVGTFGALDGGPFGRPATEAAQELALSAFESLLVQF
jgi:hypothetical protein